MELAISLMVLLMILTGAVETSLALFQFVALRDAVQEGATYASINPTDTNGIKWRTIDAASDVLVLPMANIQITANGAACEGTHTVSGSPVRNSVTVVAAFDHVITFPFVAPMIGTDTVTLHGTVTNTILQPTCP